MDQLLTIREVTTLLRINRRTMERLLKAQKITAMKIGSQWRFHPNDVEAYIKSRTLKAKAA